MPLRYVTNLELQIWDRIFDKLLERRQSRAAVDIVRLSTTVYNSLYANEVSKTACQHQQHNELFTFMHTPCRPAHWQRPGASYL